MLAVEIKNVTCSEEWEAAIFTLPPILYSEVEVHLPAQSTRHPYQAVVPDVITVYAFYAVLWGQVLLATPNIFLQASVKVRFRDKIRDMKTENKELSVRSSV